METKEELRQKRLIEVEQHLKRYYGIYTKTEMAAAIEHGRTSLSGAFNGSPDYLTDSLFKKIDKHFPGVFNLQHLLDGTGELLTAQEKARIATIENIMPVMVDQSGEQPAEDKEGTTMRDIIRLHAEVSNELQELASLKTELANSRDEFRAATKRLMQAIGHLEASSATSSFLAADGDY